MEKRKARNDLNEALSYASWVRMPEFPNITLLNRHLYPHFPDEKTEVQRGGKALVITQPA